VTLYELWSMRLTGQCKTVRKVGNHTYMRRVTDDGETYIAIILHNTDVVRAFRDGSVQLNSGGWHTKTTADRIRRYMPHPWTMHAYLGRWFITNMDTWDATHEGPKFAFKDGITILPNGKVAGADKVDAKKDAAFKKHVKAYAKKCVAAMPMPEPSGGDCWFCYMKNAEGISMGDVFNDKTHLLSHIKEGYVVPSLVYNALKHHGAGSMFYYVAFNDESRGVLTYDLFRQRTERFIYRWMLQHFGYQV